MAGKKGSKMEYPLVDGIPLEQFVSNGDVRFTWKGEERYGEVQTFPSEEVKKAARHGELLVNDAVLPVCYRIRPRDVTVVKRTWDEKDPVQKFRERAFQSARRVAKRIRQFGAGKLFNLPVADGLAWYVLTKVTARTATVQWRGFQGDGWKDITLGYRGIFPRPIIEAHVRRYEGFERLFGRRKTRNRVE